MVHSRNVEKTARKEKCGSHYYLENIFHSRKDYEYH